MPASPSAGHLLLEAAVLIFAMGCRLNRVGWARAVAAPLVHAAVDMLAGGELGQNAADDALDAARIVSAVIDGNHRGVGNDPKMAERHLEGLQTPRRKDIIAEGAQSLEYMPRCHWRVVGYDATQELWTLKVGSRNRMYLPAPPPFSWC